MSLLPLILGVGRPDPYSGQGRSAPPIKKAASSSAGSGSLSDMAFMLGKHLPKDLKEQVHERDDHSCRYCGFHTNKYQNIHHLDCNTDNHNIENLVTACIFCHQCFYIDYVGTMESGSLIWLPEIDQPSLHHIARAIYVGRISQGPMADASRTAYEVLLSRREAVIDRIGTDNPFILSTVMKDYLGPKAYAMRGKKLEGLRLFPLDKRMVQEAELKFNQFPQILAYWRSKNGPFGGKTPPQWISITQNLLQKQS